MDRKKCIEQLLDGCSEGFEEFEIYANGSFDRIYADFSLIEPYIHEKTKILDVGAVPPLMGQFVRESGKGHYTVLDPNPAPFRKFLETDYSAMIQGDISKRGLAANESLYDFVLLNEVVEHVSGNLIHSISNALSFLKPGGHILVTTPNLRSLYGLYAILVCSSGLASKPRQTVREQYERAKPDGYYGHIREYTEKEVIDLMVSFGMKHVQSDFQADYRGYGGIHKVIVALERFFPKWRLFGKYIFQKPIG